MIIFDTKDLDLRVGKPFEDTELIEALDRLPYPHKEGPWVAGGSIRRTLERESFDTDIDFFFNNQEQLDQFREDMQKWVGGILKYSGEFNDTFIVPAKSIPHDEVAEWNKGIASELTVQAIHFKFYENVEELLDSFDFTISQFAFDGTNIYASDFALWDTARKRLVPHKLTYAADSMRRMLKYANQGYTICQGAIGNMLEQVAENPTIINKEVKYID